MAGPNERDASVRLTLGADDYLVNIKRVGAETEKVERQIMKAGKAWSAGFGGAKQSLGSLAATTSGLLRTAGGLTAAFSLGTAANKAIALREQFKDLTYQVNDSGKAQVTWQQLLKEADAATLKTGKTTAELGAIMKQSFEDVGDLDYARATMVAVGQVSKATGKDMGQLANVAATLNEKFEATADTLPDMLAAVVSKLDKGGLSLESMGAKFAALAGEAVDAGFTGEKGITDLVGALNALDDRLQDRSIPAFKKLFQVIKDGSSGLKDLEKSSGLKLEGEDGLEKIRKLIGSEKGRKALEVKLGGDMRVIADQLAVPFDEAFEAAKKQSKSTKEATDEGLKAFDAFIAKLSEKGKTGTDYAEEAAKRAAEDPRVALERAMDKMAQAFLRPKLIGALDNIADKLPAVADAIASALEFVSDHPLLSAGAAIGGVAAKGAAGGLLANVAGPALGNVLKQLLWKDAVKGKGAASVGDALSDMPDWLEPTALSHTGKTIGDEVVDTIETKGRKAGKSVGGAAVEAMGEPAGLSRLGKALAIVAAAEMAYELGKAAIDQDAAETDERRNDVAMAQVAAADGVSESTQREALARAKLKLAEFQQAAGDGGELVGDNFTRDPLTGALVGQREVDAMGKTIRGPGLVQSAARGAAWVGNKLGFVSDDDYMQARDAPMRDVENTKRVVAELEEQLKKKSEANAALLSETGHGTRATPEPEVKQPNPDDYGLALARRLRDAPLNVRVINIDYVSHGTLDPPRPKGRGFDLPSPR